MMKFFNLFLASKVFLSLFYDLLVAGVSNFERYYAIPYDGEFMKDTMGRMGWPGLCVLINA